MIAWMVKRYRRWRLVRTLRRLQAELAERDPWLRLYSLPRFYRFMLRGSRAMQKACAACGVSAKDAASALAVMGQAIREAEREGADVEHLKGNLGR